jgi:hypothetical protein
MLLDLSPDQYRVFSGVAPLRAAAAVRLLRTRRWSMPMGTP